MAEIYISRNIRGCPLIVKIITRPRLTVHTIFTCRLPYQLSSQSLRGLHIKNGIHDPVYLRPY